MPERVAAFVTKILHFDEDFKEVFFAAPILERVAKGYSFVEGPVYKHAEERLYFTDFPNEKIHQWCFENGASLYTEKGNRAIGLALDHQGNIISCESRLQRLAVVDEAGSYKIVDAYDGKKFNSINDVIVAKNGDLFFTDPFSKMLGVACEQGFNGVYWWHASRDEVTVVSREFEWPNGLCLSLDESKLYVNDTGENRIYIFHKNSDGGFGKRKLFAEVDPSYGEGAPDGMKVDKFDNIWVTGPGGLWVFNPKGEKLAIIKVPEFVGNFCFGGKGRDEVFLAASSSIYRLKLAQVIK